MRSYSPCNVLLIDDDPTALELVEALLADSKPATDAKAELFRVVHVERLSLGLDALANSSQLTQPGSTNQTGIHQTGTHQTGTNQIVLLDLNLPDSQGIATLEKMRLAHPTTPTIVLTGMDDEVVAVQAIESGAQGFLQKDNLDANLLAYALLLALDRQRQLSASSSDETTEAAIQPDPSSGNAKQNEIESFERLAYSVRPATVTSSLFESGLIKDTVPEIWRGLVDTYIQILELVLEQKMFRVEHSISYRLRALAEQLGFLKAGARDIVELHTLALKKKSETESAIKTKVYADEGRLIVLELMGYLATYYRKYFIGLSKINAYKVGQTANQPRTQPNTQTRTPSKEPLNSPTERQPYS